MAIQISRKQPGATPANSYQLFEVPVFTGVNFTREFSELDDSQCALLQNYYQEQKGVWRQRPGMTKWNTAIIPTIMGVAPERVMNGIEYITVAGIHKRIIIVKYGTEDRILSADYSTKTFTEVTGATGLSHSEEWGMQAWLDGIYIGNGIEAVQLTTDGVTRAGMAVGAGGVPRKGKCLTQWHDRLVISGDVTDPTAIYFSNTLDPTVFTAANLIYAGRNDGSFVTALATTGVNTNLGAPTGQLFIFKSSSVYVFTGDIFGYASTPTLNRLSDKIGCVGQKAIIHTPELGLVWVGADGVYTSSENGYPQKMDKEVRGLFAGEISIFTYPVNVDTYGNRIAVGYSKRTGHLQISYTPAVGVGNTDQIWADMRDIPSTGIQWCGVHKGQRVSFFHEDSLGQLWGGMDNTADIFDLNSGLTDNGVAVATKFVTKNFSAGESMTEKIWRKFNIKFDIYGDTNLTISFFVDLSSVYTFSKTIGLVGSKWDAGVTVWNTAIWGYNNALGFLKGNLPVMVGTNMYIVIEGSNILSQHEIIALLLQYQSKRRFIHG